MEKNAIQKCQNTDVLNIDEDPVYVLNKFFGKVSSNTTLVAGVHNKCCFKVSMQVNGKLFSASGTTYKKAKNACARAAITNFCNVFVETQKLSSNIHVPAVSNEKLITKDVILVNSIKETDYKKFLNHLLSSKVPEDYKCENAKNIVLNKVENASIDFQRNILPLTIEEIKDDCKPSKALQNLTNFPESDGSKLKVATPNKSIALKSKSQKQVFKNLCNNVKSSSELADMLTNKVNKSQKLKKSSITTKFSTMDRVNVQTVEMKVSVKSFARNPIEKEDSNSILIEESVHKTQKMVSVNHPKPELKRRRSDDNLILFEEPLAKRSATNKYKTVNEILQKNTATYVSRSKKKENSAMTLQTLYANLNFTLEAEVGSAVVPYYMMSAMTGGRKFFGHGKTKQLAQKDAAVQILKHFKNHPIQITHSNSFFRSQSNEPNFQQIVLPNNPENREMLSLQLPSHLADIVESKIMQKFDQLTRGRQENLEYKVVAGIVMTFDMNFEQAEVVSIATGTKCVNGGNICCNGSVLNDSHAEIIAKRGLMKFLYAQLRWHCEPHSARLSIFQPNPNGLQIPYSLKPNVRFHLYINTAPCGDARIFSFHHHNRLNNMATTSFNSGQCGQLRTKVEGDMGTTPVGTRYNPQTWDGVILREPLLTMSCSDKIARWNVVGIQGALLSQIVEPIYLNSIVLGSMFSAQHIYRATCGRIQHTLGYLPQPYCLNRPLLGQTSTRLPRNTYRVPSIGINWTWGDNDIEIISLPTGRTIYNETSFLSKQTFFYKFNFLLNNLPNIGGACMTNNYAEAKENARDFQIAKTELLAAFYRADLGTWVKKPVEQNEFTMNLN